MSDIALVIPARLGSTRLHRKALADIEGQPMVVRVAQQAAKVPQIQRVLVATDSQEIADAVSKAGFQSEMTPVELNSGTERVAWVAKNLSERIIINLQGDEPVMQPDTIAAAVSAIRESDAPMGSVFTKFVSMEEAQSPSCVKVLMNQKLEAIYFSRHLIPFRQNKISDEELMAHPYWGKHMGIYSYQKDFLLRFPALSPSLAERAESLEQLRALHHGFKISLRSSLHGSQSVDTAEDLEAARKIFRETRSKNG